MFYQQVFSHFPIIILFFQDGAFEKLKRVKPTAVCQSNALNISRSIIFQNMNSWLKDVRSFPRDLG